MGANRKLQAEIDRTLKKVNEGIEVFDQIWEKVTCSAAAAAVLAMHTLLEPMSCSLTGDAHMVALSQVLTRAAC